MGILVLPELNTDQIKEKVSSFIYDMHRASIHSDICVVYNDLAKTNGSPVPERAPFINISTKISGKLHGYPLCGVALQDYVSANCALSVWRNLNIGIPDLGEIAINIFEAYVNWCGRSIVFGSDRNTSSYGTIANIRKYGKNYKFTDPILNLNTKLDIVMFYKDLNGEHYRDYGFVQTF